ncbi:hypothetical protein ACM66B_001223 [Microbotryomycetes sp. NB124-2]
MPPQLVERKIASAACQLCRKRRSRCVIPPESRQCALCVELGQVCDFQGRDRRRETLQDLKIKVDEYETLLYTLRTCSDTELAAILSRPARTGHTDSAVQHQSSDDDREFLSGIMDRLALDSEGNLRAYGSLSNQLLSTASLKEKHSASLLPVSDELAAPPAEYPAKLSATFLLGAANNIQHLPLGTDIRLVDHLLWTYFMWHNTSFQIMSRSLFQRDLERGSGACFSPLLLNAVLAVSCHMCDWPIAREVPDLALTAGDQFFKAAKALLDEGLDADRPGITTIQALALMAKREVFCGRGQRAGLYFVMCARLVLDLGLHLDVSSHVATGKITTEHAYVRSVCFWGVWSLDKEFTALLGRPCILRNIVITCPKPEYWPQDDFDWATSLATGSLQAARDGQRGTMHAAAAAVGMSESFLKSMEQIYWNVSQRSFAEMLQELEALLLSTSEAIGRLPSVALDAAQAPTPPTVSVHIYYQSHIIMSCRPLLMVRSDGWNELLNDRKRCIDAARQIVRLTGIFKQSSKYGLVKTINAHQHCLVLAASVFLYELLLSAPSSPSAVGLDREMALCEIHHVLAFLDELSSFRPVAKQASANLRAVLHQRVLSHAQFPDQLFAPTLPQPIDTSIANVWIDSLDLLPSLATESISFSGTATPTRAHIDSAVLFENLFGSSSAFLFNKVDGNG